MKQVVIFCESYPQVKYTLCIARHNYRDCSITVVIPHKYDLFKFFKLANEKLFHNTINVVYFELYRRRIATKASRIKKILYILPDIVNERRRLKEIYNEYFAGLRGAEVFFFSRHFVSYSFYILKRLSGANRLVFMPDEAWDILLVDKYTPTSIVDLAILVMMKLTFGWDITRSKLNCDGRGISSISDAFINKKVDKVISREEENGVMKSFDWRKFKVFDTSNYSVIYFDSPSVAGITDYDIHKRELTEIFTILGKYFPEKEIARKYHPDYPCDKAMLEIGDILPDFIPAELLYNDKVKMYLGINSCSITNVEKGLVVSIMYLITGRNDEARQQSKERLIQMSRSEILFPKSLDEFERIVAGAKGDVLIELSKGAGNEKT